MGLCCLVCISQGLLNPGEGREGLQQGTEEAGVHLDSSYQDGHSRPQGILKTEDKVILPILQIES